MCEIKVDFHSGLQFTRFSEQKERLNALFVPSSYSINDGLPLCSYFVAQTLIAGLQFSWFRVESS